MIATIIYSLIKKIGLQDKLVWGAYKILQVYTHSCGDKWKPGPIVVPTQITMNAKLFTHSHTHTHTHTHKAQSSLSLKPIRSSTTYYMEEQVQKTSIVKDPQAEIHEAV